jgi:phage terminase large subunit
MKADPDYIKRLRALDDRERRALLDGDWELSEGRFFESFERTVHVIEPFEIPDEWPRYISLDYGLDMLAAYKIAVDTNCRAYVLAEVYEGKDCGKEGLIVSQAALRLKELMGIENIRAVFAPPDLWNRQKDSGKSIARLFFENGITLTKVSSSRVAGWLELKEWLRVYADEKNEPSANLRIFNGCTNLIRTMSLLQCDSQNPSDCARSPHELTHAPDALRYFVVGGPKSAPSKPVSYRYGFEFEKPKAKPTGIGDKIKII